MTTYIFKANSADIEIAHSYEPWLFQQPNHLKLQAEEGWLSFYAINKKSVMVDAHLHLCIQNSVAYSPLKATFGSIQCSSKLELSVLAEFIEYIIKELQIRGIKEVILKNPSDGYGKDWSSMFNTVLFNWGFQIETAEVSTILYIDEEFQHAVSPWEKRKLRQAYSSGLKFQQVSRDRLVDVYSFILTCREEREYTLAIDWDTLQRTANTFPDKFLLFVVMQDAKVAAASICINIGNNVLYNFHSAHPREYDHLSPVVMLLEGIYNFGKSRNYSILDLGTSAINNKPNFGLLDFKLGIGGKPSMKLTLKKTL